MRLKEMCADEMPREKMLTKGADALTNTDLLAILLRTGKGGKNVLDMARELLLSGDGSLSGLAEMNIDIRLGGRQFERLEEILVKLLLA